MAFPSPEPFASPLSASTGCCTESIPYNIQKDTEVFFRRPVSTPGMLDPDLGLLSSAERAQACRYRSWLGRQRFIQTRILLRQLLGRRLAISPDQIELVMNAFGKPQLARYKTQRMWHFSLSHCPEWIALALNPTRPVGIDIEPLRSIPEADTVVRQLYSNDEQDAYFSLHSDTRPRAFLRAWTCKEAQAKAVGTGFYRAHHCFNTSITAHLFQSATHPGWLYHECSPDAQHIGAVVTHHIPWRSLCPALPPPG